MMNSSDEFVFIVVDFSYTGGNLLGSLGSLRSLGGCGLELSNLMQD